MVPAGSSRGGTASQRLSCVVTDFSYYTQTSSARGRPQTLNRPGGTIGNREGLGEKRVCDKPRALVGKTSPCGENIPLWGKHPLVGKTSPCGENIFTTLPAPLNAYKTAPRKKPDTIPKGEEERYRSQPPPSLSPGPGQGWKVSPGKGTPEVGLAHGASSPPASKVCRSHCRYARCICAQASIPWTISSPAGPHDLQKAFACSAKLPTNSSWPSSPCRASSPGCFSSCISILLSQPIRGVLGDTLPVGAEPKQKGRGPIPGAPAFNFLSHR